MAAAAAPAPCDFGSRCRPLQVRDAPADGRAVSLPVSPAEAGAQAAQHGVTQGVQSLIFAVNMVNAAVRSDGIAPLKGWAPRSPPLLGSPLRACPVRGQGAGGGVSMVAAPNPRPAGGSAGFRPWLCARCHGRVGLLWGVLGLGLGVTWGWGGPGKSSDPQAAFVLSQFPARLSHGLRDPPACCSSGSSTLRPMDVPPRPTPARCGRETLLLLTAPGAFVQLRPCVILGPAETPDVPVSHSSSPTAPPSSARWTLEPCVSSCCFQLQAPDARLVPLLLMGPQLGVRAAPQLWGLVMRS